MSDNRRTRKTLTSILACANLRLPSACPVDPFPHIYISSSPSLLHQSLDMLDNAAMLVQLNLILGDLAHAPQSLRI